MDVELQLLQAREHRQGGHGHQLPGRVRYLLPGIHLAGDKQGKILGEVLVKGLPEFERFFASDVFKIKRRGLLGFFL
jgi:hypothetical protein